METTPLEFLLDGTGENRRHMMSPVFSFETARDDSRSKSRQSNFADLVNAAFITEVKIHWRRLSSLILGF